MASIISSLLARQLWTTNSYFVGNVIKRQVLLTTTLPIMSTRLLSLNAGRTVSMTPQASPTTMSRPLDSLWKTPWNTDSRNINSPLSSRFSIDLFSQIAVKYVWPSNASIVRHPFNVSPVQPTLCPTGLENGLANVRLPPFASHTLPRSDRRSVVPLNNRRPNGRRPIEKIAARLIRIRRRKMKKHKLRKLRKRMLHVFAKARHSREVKKEKIFQEELLAQMNRADEFDARAWVHEFLHKATTDPQTLVPEKPKRTRPTRYVLD